MNIKKLITLTTNFFLLLTLQACGSSNTAQMVSPSVPVYEEPSYETAQCQQMTIRDTRTIRFTYQAAQEETLSYSESNVRYSAFFVSPGAVVQQGELLCELDLEDYPDLLLASEDTLADLKDNLSLLDERLSLSLKRQRIEDTGLTYRERQNAENAVYVRYSQEKTELEDQIHILQERITQYQDMIQKRQIYAPFDGTITYVYTPDAEDFSKSGKDIITVTNASQMLFTAKTEYCSYFQPGVDYTLTVNGEDKIASVVSSDDVGGTVALSLKTPDYTLEDGASGTIELSLEEKEHVLAIPKKALSTINGTSVVYVPGNDGFKTYREVETGIENLTYVEIISGLKEGDEVLLPD